MKLIVDTHVHIYPFYEIHKALDAVLKNFNALSSDAVKVACLTERYDCHVYDDLATNSKNLVGDAFDIAVSNTGHSLKIKSTSTGQDFCLLPGQQIITSENLEILSLNCPQRVEEGLPARQTIENVIKNNGVPVVAWGLGKWIGKRGGVVKDLLNTFTPEQLAVGDTTMRPYGWFMPLIMRQAKAKGFKIIFGSDPLPFPGEECRPGSYATEISSSASDKRPREVIANMLTQNVIMQSVGHRCSLIDVAQRTLGHRKASKIAATKTSH